jgi:hypothetical protein
VELAEAVSAALGVMGYSALVPGARSYSKLCEKADLVVIDSRDRFFVPRKCSQPRVLEVEGSPAEAAAYVLRSLRADEAVIGVDPGYAVTGYALLSGNTLIHGSVLSTREDDVSCFVCKVAEKAPSNTVIGIGAAPAVVDYALSLADEIRDMCGLNAILVDEHGSNSELPLGLNGVTRYNSVHVRAAAVIALRTRMRSMRLL